MEGGSRSASSESIITCDSEISGISSWLEPVQGSGQPADAHLTSLPPDAHRHPLQSLNQSPTISTSTHTANSASDWERTSMNVRDVEKRATKTKGKLGASFEHIFLIQKLTDAEFPIQGAIFCLCFSPNGHYLAAAGADKVIRIWTLLVEDALHSTSPPSGAHIFREEPILR